MTRVTHATARNEKGSRFPLSICTVCFLIGGILGYEFAPEDNWSAACVGALMMFSQGFTAVAVIAPTAYSRALRGRGAGSTWRVSPASGSLLIGILYLIFRRLLGAPALWSAITIVGVLVGLVAAMRLLNTIVYDD